MSEPLEFAVFGDPIAHSKSPRMHAAAFAAMGLPHRYGRRRVAQGELGEALARAWDEGLAGLNLTLPLKVEALAWVSELAESAAAIGAANTLVRGESGWVAHNTDAEGFARALAELDPTPPRRAVVLGSGGASRAVLHALSRFEDLELLQVQRHVDDDGGCAHARCDYAAFAEMDWPADLWVNCTVVGMAGGPQDFPARLPLEGLERGARVVDIVYPGAPGGLLDRAAAQGAKTQDGLRMLLWQGVAAEELWLGRAPLPAEAVAAMGAALGIE